MGGEIYRCGRSYGSNIPDGGNTRQALVKRTNANGDITWADVGTIFAYVVGNVPYASSWLSLTSNGDALTPDPNLVYLIISAGDYYHNFVRWNATDSEYVTIASGGAGGGGGAIFSFVDSTKTALDSDWLKDSDNNTIVPKNGLLYLVLTAGPYYNSLYRFDETIGLYVLVQAGKGGGAVFSYVVGNTPFAADWLSDEVNGSAITPDEGSLYLVLSAGDYQNIFYRWGGSSYLEVIRCCIESIAPKFNPQTAYVEGNCCSYNNKLYMFDTAHQGSWDAADVTEISVTDMIPTPLSAADLEEIKAEFDGLFAVSGSSGMSYLEKPVGLWVDDEQIIYEITVTGTTITEGTIGEISTGLTGIAFCWIERFVVSNGEYVRNLIESVSISEDGSTILMVADDDSLFKNKTFYATIKYLKLEEEEEPEPEPEPEP